MRELKENLQINSTIKKLSLSRVVCVSPFVTFNSRFSLKNTEFINSNFQYFTNLFLYSNARRKSLFRQCSFSHFSNSAIFLEKDEIENWNLSYDSYQVIQDSTKFVLCTFDNCEIPGSTGGGAIQSYGRILKLFTCNFTYNRALGQDARGGAVFCIGQTRSVIDSCRFSHNRANKDGGAVYFDSSNGISRIRRNEFYNNSCLNYGGGLYLVRDQYAVNIIHLYFDNMNDASNYTCFYIKNLQSVSAGEIYIEIDDFREPNLLYYGLFYDDDRNELDIKYEGDKTMILVPSKTFSPLPTPTQTLKPTFEETPIQTLQETPFRTPIQTLPMTPDVTPFRTPIQTFEPTVMETPNPTMAPTPCITPQQTLIHTQTFMQTLSPSISATFPMTLRPTPVQTLRPTPAITPINTATAVPTRSLFPATNPFTPSNFFTPAMTPGLTPESLQEEEKTLNWSPLGISFLVIGIIFVLIGVIANIILCSSMMDSCKLILEPEL
jgi:predicted outer membrane repeat protein